MKKFLVLFMSLAIPCAFLFAQNTFRGTVTGEGGEKLSGASVLVEGTNNGTVTDTAGNFSIRARSGQSLRVSYSGYKPKTVKVANNMNIVLDYFDDAGDEIVVIGYGTARRRDLTGSVGVVSNKELVKAPVPNAAEALTGRLAGVQVTTTEGSPDAEVKVRLRGGGSISQDNSPLYIVDGFPVSSIANIAASDIATMTFLKDASATAIYGSRGANGVILITTKEGAAGRTIVTANFYAGFRNITKELEVLNPYEYVMYQYELDPSSTTFQNYYGVYSDLDIYKSVKGTNWQNEVFGRTAPLQYYNVGVSGGSKAARYNLGLTRNDEESVMLGSGYVRNNINFKLNSEISKKLSFDFNTRLSQMTIEGAGVNTGAGSTTRLRNSVKYAPTRGLREFSQSILDDDDINNPESASLLYNPVESVLDDYKKQNRLGANINAGLNWKITKDLTLRSTGGYEIDNRRTESVWGPATSQSRNYGGQPIGNINTNEATSWRISNFFTYNKLKIYKNHDINFVLGQELLSQKYKIVENESRFFPIDMKAEDVLANMVFGTPIPTSSYISADDNLESYFGRLNYTIDNKYLFTGTFRADGSSKFAPGNQWGFFPSGAFAWNISNEQFFEKYKSVVNMLKLRLSIGTVGNNRIPNNAWQLIYNTNNENKPYFPNETEAPNFIPGNFLYNPNLKWETTVTRNVGLDFSFFRSRLTGSVDYYNNNTNDLLIQAPLSTSSGYANQYQNLGKTSNKGIEFTLNADIVNNDNFQFSASFNIGFNKNKVVYFRNGEVDYKTYTSGWNGTAQPLEDYLIQQGYPVGQMYGYVTDGMYSFDDFTFNTTTNRWVLNSGVADNSNIINAGAYFGPGTLKFKDISGPNGTPDGKIDNYDKTVIGNANPKHVGGFNLQFGYKGIDLSALFNWVYGNNIYNANKLDFTSYLLSRRYQNLISEMSLENRFTTIDPLTGYNVFYGANANPERLREINQNATIWHPIMTATPLHSWAIEDGSFLRLNTLTLGYTLPQKFTKKAAMSNVRIYFTGYNIFVWTNYSGYDPEVDTRRNPPLTPGVDYSAYPKSRTFVAGLNVTF